MNKHWCKECGAREVDHEGDVCQECFRSGRWEVPIYIDKHGERNKFWRKNETNKHKHEDD